MAKKRDPVGSFNFGANRKPRKVTSKSTRGAKAGGRRGGNAWTRYTGGK